MDNATKMDFSAVFKNGYWYVIATFYDDDSNILEREEQKTNFSRLEDRKEVESFIQVMKQITEIQIEEMTKQLGN
jgi:hypothetical protein